MSDNEQPIEGTAGAALKKGKMNAGAIPRITPASEPWPMLVAERSLKLSVKIPLFWYEDPEVWFAQIEAQFAVTRFTGDNAKFNIVVSHRFVSA